MPPAALPGAKRSRLILGSRGTAYGLRPKPLLHSGSVGSFQGHQGFASPRSSPVRCSPVPGCAPRAASGRALDTLSTPTAKPAIRKRPSSPQEPFPGFCIPKGTQKRENALRAVFEPLVERRAGQGPQGWLARPAAKRGHGPPRRAKRTLDATKATTACTRGGRDEGRSPPPLPPELPGGEGGACRGAAPLCPSPQGAEQVAPKASLTRVASARPGARCRRSGAAVRYESRLHIVSVLYIISVLIRFAQIRYERSNDHGTSGHHF